MHTEPEPANTYLLILSEREAVAWVLRTSRMAFPATRRAEVERLKVGDRLLLLTTRGCWHNPTRDRTRVIGLAKVTSPVRAYDEPVTIAGRDFTRGCGLRMEALSPYRTGVELVPLVPRMEAFPDTRPGAWAVRLRRPLLQLSAADADLLTQEINKAAGAPEDLVPEYVEKVRLAVSGR
ncbi:hypothetical protein A6A08_07015 [Nocardiopsis sp. TSRI0078]|uniref:hypothetical protein n=1 Tax=unclassified Nocardiopsis TaxID=2649073 RepID=UPI000963050F|nr:hypothetical protein [Nocardiopsis sp. TSRI0078]OKI17252.1 hypothetical protein A6A08_07015 [Nocardiopsis sp. TSRI0078]